MSVSLGRKSYNNQKEQQQLNRLCNEGVNKDWIQSDSGNSVLLQKKKRIEERNYLKSEENGAARSF